MLSSRHVTTVLVALCVALVPTVVNSYLGRRVVETPALREALPETLGGSLSSVTERRASTIKKEFGSEDWVERQYMDAAGQSVVVLAVRAYDMKRLYHHPELAISEVKYERQSLVQVPTPEGPVDVHVLHADSAMAAYVLSYKGRTVGNPYLFQLQVAPELLLLGQRPLTMVFAEGQAPPEGVDLASSTVVQQAVAALAAVRKAA